MPPPLSYWNRATAQMASRVRPMVGTQAARRSAPPPSHNLVLYEYEASPWCRLVREYLTILDLTAEIRPCPRQTLFREGAFDSTSAFRPEAMQHLKSAYKTDDLTFPLLVDYTKPSAIGNEDNTQANDPVVVHQSYDILTHLWDRYGQNVLPSGTQTNSNHNNPQRRPDQYANATTIPFIFRFLSLASPSYFRAWPTCGIFQTKSLRDKLPSTPKNASSSIILYQTEGCWESRMVREALCTLEIPYRSVPVGEGSYNQLLPHQTSTSSTSIQDKRSTPLLVIDNNQQFQGAEECVAFLWDTYRDPKASLPHFGQDLWGRSLNNVGRRNGSFGLGAYTAFVKGSRAFVPTRALE